MPENNSPEIRTQEEEKLMDNKPAEVNLEQPNTIAAIDEILVKAYGEYPGCLNEEFIKKYCGDSNDVHSEIAIFMEYYDATLVLHRFWRTLPWGVNLVPRNAETLKEYSENEFASQFLIKQTSKFGVNTVRIEEWRHKWKYGCDESFQNWYNYWEDFFINLKKNKRKFKTFYNALKKWKNMYPFLPETNRKGEKRESVAQPKTEVVEDK